MFETLPEIANIHKSDHIPHFADIYLVLVE